SRNTSRSALQHRAAACSTLAGHGAGIGTRVVRGSGVDAQVLRSSTADASFVRSINTSSVHRPPAADNSWSATPASPLPASSQINATGTSARHFATRDSTYARAPAYEEACRNFQTRYS